MEVSANSGYVVLQEVVVNDFKKEYEIVDWDYNRTRIGSFAVLRPGTTLVSIDDVKPGCGVVLEKEILCYYKKPYGSKKV